MYPCITLWGVCQVGRRRKLLCGTGLSLLASEVWSFWHQCKKRREQGPAELQGLLPPCKSLLHHVSSEKFGSCLSLAFRWTIQTIPALVVPWFTVFTRFPSRLTHLFSAAAQMLISRAGRWAPDELGQGAGRGLGLTIPYPRAGLTLPTSLSEWISILTPPKSRALCPSHSVSHSFTRVIVSDFFCPNHIPSLQFNPSCFLQSTKNMENRLYSFPIQLFFMYLNIVNIPGSPEYVGFVSSTPEYNTELFKAVNFPY